MVIFNNGSPQNATLPVLTNANKGIQFYIKNIGSGVVTLTGSSFATAGNEQKIDSQQSFDLSQGDSMKVIGFSIGPSFEWGILSYHNV